MDSLPLDSIAIDNYFANSFAFGNNPNNFCCIARNFHPLGWTPSTSSTSSSTSTTTTVVPSTTTSTSSSTSTSTTTVVLTTTTTTINCPEGFLYTVNLYDCNTCLITGNGGISNSEPLTIGNWYYDPILNTKFQVIAFDQCFGFNRQISNSSGKATCEEVICPTTTTTTTIPIPFITLGFEDLTFTTDRLGIIDSSDVEEWNVGLDNWFGGGSGIAFTSVEITGDIVKLSGGLEEIIALELDSLGLTSFDTTGGLSSLVFLILLGNPNYTDFNTSVPLTSSTINEILLRDCGLTSFNPTFPLPEGLEFLVLNNNPIINFNPTHLLPNSLTNLQLTGCGLTNFGLTSLPSNLQNLSIDNNTLTTFNATLISSTLQQLHSQVNALDTTSINAILAKTLALNWGTSYILSLQGGTNACPTGQGLIDKAALITNGCNVTTNICTTTTSTSLCVSNSYVYSVTIYICPGCAPAGSPSRRNATRLTIGKYYREPSTGFVFLVNSFVFCSGEAPETFILDSDKKDSCTLACPTTTTTTTT